MSMTNPIDVMAQVQATMTEALDKSLIARQSGWEASVTVRPAILEM
jgi:hypothetical protein